MPQREPPRTLCVLTYTQFDQGTITAADFTAIGPQLTGALAGYSVTALGLTPFTVSEAVEPGPNPGDVGDYTEVQGGFGVLLALTKAGQPTLDFTVVALRGTSDVASARRRYGLLSPRRRHPHQRRARLVPLFLLRLHGSTDGGVAAIDRSRPPPLTG